MLQAMVFRTLADPTRLLLLEALRGGEQPVNELVAKVDIHQSGVSRHLRLLHEAGFVQVRPDGPRRLYSLRPEPFREIEAWIEGYRSLWEARLDRFAQALERKRKGGAGARKERES
jgi:DNA-binding transcriptional ArsR family regulator